MSEAVPPSRIWLRWSCGGMLAVSFAAVLGVSTERGGGTPSAPPAPRRAVRAATPPATARRAARVRSVRRRRAWTQPVGLTVLHTNDLHGHVLGRGERPADGGLVALGRAIFQARDEARARGDGVLLLDAGDLWQGTPEGNLTSGEVVVAWLNRMGYDAVVVGNHEFDHGVAALVRLASLAEQPWLACNLLEEASGVRPGWLGRGSSPETPDRLRGAGLVKIVRCGDVDVRVGIVGVTSADTEQLTAAGRTEGLRFRDEVRAVEDALAALPPVDVVLLLSHAGLEEPAGAGSSWGGPDVRLAAAFDGRVDVVIGGHSHTRLESGLRVGGVLVAQAGANGEALGQIRLRLRPPRPTGPRAGRPLVEASASLRPPGDDLYETLAPYLRAVEEQVGLPPGGLEGAAEPVGELTAPLRRSMEYESSALGNLVTDLMRGVSQDPPIDVAFQNKTGLRADLEAGPIAWRDIYEVAPFGNTVVTLLLRGADLRDLLEGMLRAPKSLLEFSGLEVVCDPARPLGERLVSVAVGGRPLDDEAIYVVATSDFLAAGGDGHEAFTRGLHPRDTGVRTRDLLLRYFAERAKVSPPPVEQRLRLAPH
ncbi:MAG: bifunctional metallophosphatase/5'-nucleotidase [Planctomycetota bacterium]|nr:MAG: bifunctional metallophosphatase/5'-nucleotidase [Planctomycetota bacterium]